MTAPCARCGYVHSEHTATAAVGRFSWPTPMYRADYAGSPLRPTRTEAHTDMCDHYATLPKENDR